MRCAVCNDRLHPDPVTYRLGDVAGALCIECGPSLGDAVRVWVLRRMRDVEAERLAVDRALEKAVEKELDDNAREQSRARALVHAELFPSRPKQFRLMGVRQ